jgi:ketosteroid isomerase-like protein
MFEGMVARTYEALERKDLDAVMSYWAEDSTWEYPGRTPMSGRFVGKPAIRAWWERWLARMASVHFTVKHAALGNPLRLGTANTLFVEWEADITTSDGLSARPAGVTVITIRHGKTVHARDYFLDPTLLERVWGTAPARAA